METKFISKEKIKLFIDSIEGEIFLPSKIDNYFSWSRYNRDDFSFEGFRPYLSPKFFFYSPCEILKERKTVKRAVIGIKACDLKGILFLKKVFKEGEFIDPFFRDDVLIVSSDCTYIHENCFCSLLGDNPYPEEGFDLNLSEIKEGSTSGNGFVVEIGSDRGKKLIEENTELFSPADSNKLEQREHIRNKVRQEIKGEKIELAKITNPEKIADEIKKCVSCASCTNVCPSCFCFLLGEKEGFEKVRFWDSCQYPGYARVAGGVNPRKELNNRFINRIKCKFEYSPERFGSRGCFGCGRCIGACYGGIDFKNVLQSL